MNCWMFLFSCYNTRMNMLVFDRPSVRPDMQYCSRSRCFHPDPGTKHISVPPRHMTKPYARISNMISQHYRYKDTTSHTIGIQLPQIQYNNGRYMSEYRLQSNAYWQRKKHRSHNHTGPGPPPGSA